MRKILIAGILVAVVLASIGLVTAGNGFGPGDGTGESDKVCDDDGYGPGDGTCNGDGSRDCESNCKQFGEGNGICDGQCDGKLNKNQYNKGNCWKNSNSNGCCKRE
jgi:hypothetical protein